jgi:hypothetical protein
MDESLLIVISEWNLLMVKYWAKAGFINRMRLRRKTTNIINLHGLQQLLIDFFFLNSAFCILSSAF